MRRGAALALFAIAALCQLLPARSIAACQTPNQSDPTDGGCPVSVTPEPVRSSKGFYAERITVHVWIKDEDFSRAPKVELHLPNSKIVRTPVLKKRKCNGLSVIRARVDEKNRLGELKLSCNTCQLSRSSGIVTLRKLEYFWKMESNEKVTVHYKTNSSECAVSHKVPDPTPNFNVSVDFSSKSVNVTVAPGGNVHARFCYRNPPECKGGPAPLKINPAHSQWAIVNLTHLLPCVCIQAYFTHIDAKRSSSCPLRNSSLTDVRDVWSTSELKLYHSNLALSLMCPASDLKISASLCWRHSERLCTPVLNSTLDRSEKDNILDFNTSAVDKHPQMCVQFSLQGNSNIRCPFPTDISSWEMHNELGKQSVYVYVNSSAPATFSAQLCILSDQGCAPTGPVTSVRADGGTAEARVAVPPQVLAERPCVQVWQSHPELLGRRILCPDYTHSRSGLYVVAVLVFVVSVALLGWFMYSVTKNGAANWLHIQKPVLLVCSSDQPPHVSAVCTLASVLQGELGATVHMALFAQSSQAPGGVADLGPLPWLYGQWEAVRKARGKVLIAWSPEAGTTYERWREKRAGEADPALKTAAKSKKNTGKKDPLCDSEKWTSKPSTLIEPVFTAALACLEGALQEGSNHGVALVCFQGLGHSRDIPKVFRSVPRYCIPQDFGGVIRELGGTAKHAERFRCWPRLTSKVLAAWLARKLAARLRTLLPQSQREGTQGASPKKSWKLRFPPRVAKEPGSRQEREALRGSPWRPQVSSG